MRMLRRHATVSSGVSECGVVDTVSVVDQGCIASSSMLHLFKGSFMHNGASRARGFKCSPETLTLSPSNHLVRSDSAQPGLSWAAAADSADRLDPRKGSALSLEFYPGRSA